MHTLSLRLRLILLLCLSVLVIAPLTKAHAEPLKVVASFSILSDLVQQVGGEQVQISTLVKPDSDAHMYEPTAQDARLLSQADILFVNGLGFEPWLPRLRNAAGFTGTEVVVSQGVTPRRLNDEHDDAHAHNHDDHDHDHDVHDHGEFDPHAWQNVANAIIYVRNIEAALSQADPAHAAIYAQRAQNYIKELHQLERDIRDALATLSPTHRTLVTTHDSLGYFAQAYGLTLISPMGFSTSTEPSAADIARLIEQIRSQQVCAVFLENVSNPKMIQRIAQETGAVVGGTLYSDALSAPGTAADSYIGMMRSNLTVLIKALSGKLITS